MHDDEIFRQLHAADWAAIGRRLLAFAIWRSWAYEWRSGRPGELALGHTVEDIVQETIKKALIGERRWDPDKGPLIPWLIDQVKSVMDHLYETRANQVETSLDEKKQGALVETAETVAVQGYDYNSEVASQVPNPERTVIELEGLEQARQYASEQTNLLYEAVIGHPELEEILDAVMNGCETKPQALAEATGLPVGEINNRLKRLRHRAKQLHPPLKKEEDEQENGSSD